MLKGRQDSEIEKHSPPPTNEVPGIDPQVKGGQGHHRDRGYTRGHFSAVRVFGAGNGTELLGGRMLSGRSN